MARFTLAAPLTVPLALLKPVYSDAYGVGTKSYPAIEDGERINGNLRTFGGTERDVNGLYSIENTATVQTWFRPDITADCRIGVLETGQVYDIIGTPEDIEMRHQYLQIRLQAVKGGA